MPKSAVRLAREALRADEAALPAYSSRFPRHDFTEPQRLALLALRQFLRTDYRSGVTLVAEWSELHQALGLRKVPPLARAQQEVCWIWVGRLARSNQRPPTAPRRACTGVCRLFAIAPIGGRAG
jgi:hypothetical protein